MWRHHWGGGSSDVPHPQPGGAGSRLWGLGGSAVRGWLSGVSDRVFHTQLTCVRACSARGGRFSRSSLFHAENLCLLRCCLIKNILLASLVKLQIKSCSVVLTPQTNRCWVASALVTKGRGLGQLSGSSTNGALARGLSRRTQGGGSWGPALGRRAGFPAGLLSDDPITGRCVTRVAPGTLLLVRGFPCRDFLHL